jgi:diadenosine tetraphosphate (Ap4A) HIT family hydrolase
VAFPDGFPVSDGHLLVVPRRHVDRLEELDHAEWSGLFGLVHELAIEIRRDPSVDGLNIGVNSGAAAGQTVEHAHVHLIPRRWGDVEDPRGGVRWVIADRADY